MTNLGRRGDSIMIGNKMAVLFLNKCSDYKDIHHQWFIKPWIYLCVFYLYCIFHELIKSKLRTTIPNTSGYGQWKLSNITNENDINNGENRYYVLKLIIHMACDPVTPAIGINPTEMHPVELEAIYNTVLTVRQIATYSYNGN